jgi:uncharacterized phage protein (TIGR01671 family)
MREIAFKAWDKKRKEMCVIESLSFMYESASGILATVIESLRICAVRGNCYKRDIMPEHLILLEYTGLKDNIGMEICESDIVETNGIDGKLLWEVCYVIDFCSSGFKLCGINHNYSSCHNQVWETGKVVGNIYENTELLLQEA